MDVESLVTIATTPNLAVGVTDQACDANVTSAAANAASRDEIVLMQRLAAGDAAAMDRLAAEYGPGLHRLVARLTGWSPDADDVLQEVLIAAWRKAHRFHGTGALAGWLRTLAVNTCHSRLRALRKLQNRFRPTPDLQSVPAHEPRPPTAREQTLAAALAKLRQADRTVLVLFYMEELSGEEVAGSLGIGVGAVHARLSRARTRLRELMEAHEQTDREK